MNKEIEEVKQELARQRYFNNNMFQHIIDTLENHNENIILNNKAIERVSSNDDWYRDVCWRIVFIMAGVWLIADIVLFINLY